MTTSGTGEEAFKRALGCWASGVAVVTTRAESSVHGMTVTAFTSVSLAPPLVLVCAGSKSYMHALLCKSGVFAVSILAAGQEALANRFAGRDGVTDRFEGIAYGEGTLRCPLLEGAVATIECRVVQNVEAGDHVIYIGAVEHTSVESRDPLLYHGNDYQQIIHGRRKAPRSG